MSHTNSTTNYNLPQFLTTDKPAWLTDINNAFYDIDGTMKNNADAASAAQGDATQALTDAGNAQTTANTADGKGSGAIASIADTFDTTSTYAVGEYVIYNNLLYICTTAITVPGAWNAGSWNRTTVEAILATKANTSSLAGVATTGSYLDQNNKPTIPEFVTQTLNTTFDSNGRGTYTNPTGYVPIYAGLDNNWNIVIHTPGNVVAHGWQDYSTLIKSTSVNIGYVFMKV